MVSHGIYSVSVTNPPRYRKKMICKDRSLQHVSSGYLSRFIVRLIPLIYIYKAEGESVESVR